jgi:hypothetical protein
MNAKTHTRNVGPAVEEREELCASVACRLLRVYLQLASLQPAVHDGSPSDGNDEAHCILIVDQLP